MWNLTTAGLFTVHWYVGGLCVKDAIYLIQTSVGSLIIGCQRKPGSVLVLGPELEIAPEFSRGSVLLMHRLTTGAQTNWWKTVGSIYWGASHYCTAGGLIENTLMCTELCLPDYHLNIFWGILITIAITLTSVTHPMLFFIHLHHQCNPRSHASRP